MSSGPDQRPGVGPDNGTSVGPEDGGVDEAGNGAGPTAPEDTSSDDTASEDTSSDDTSSDEVADTPEAAADDDTTTAGDGTVDGSVDDPAVDTPDTPDHPVDPVDEATDGSGAQGDNGVGPAAAGSADDGEPPTGEPPEEGDDATFSVEDLVQDLERVTAERDQLTAERDQYLDTSRRIQAEFENYRKQVAKREVETRERAAESLVADLLPVLDACDGALASGASDVEPVRTALVDVLTRKGLARIDTAEEPFDPAKHDAVLHEPGDGDDGPMVAEVMRAGYSWNGRVVRPAMVRVRGG